ncbi:MAG: hypothetical protein KTR30_08695 [Saprospiraceae bacterium]|nr:hypothetical protein [Saprospiraceae bacterium]
MILRFRKRHRLMWILIGVLLPLAYVLALLARPGEIETEGTQLNQPSTQIVREVATTPTLDAWLSNDELNNHYLEIDYKETAKHPLATFYLGSEADGKIDAYRLLGAVGAQGRQRFLLDSIAIAQGQQYLLQYDPIKKEKIATIALKME